MKMYLILLFLLLMLVHSTVWSQQEVNYNLYQYHLNLTNPAATGTQGAPFLNMSLRSQWLGIQGAPETQAISAGFPHANNRLGTGFSVINDLTFVENQTQFFLDFSYRLPLADDRNLYLGLKAGGTSIRIETNRLETYGTDLVDPFLQGTSGFVPNFGVGIYYTTPHYFLSVSIPRLLETERFRLENEQVTHATDRLHLFASSGFRIRLSEYWDFSPSLLFSYVDAAPTELLVDASFSYDDRFDIGLQASRSGSMGGIMFIHISEGMKMGYAYITSATDKVNQFSSGTHEIVLKIKLNEGVGGDSRKASFTNELKTQPQAREEKVGTKNKNNELFE